MHLLLKVLKVKANSYQVDTTGDPLFYNVIRWRIIMGHGSLFTLFLKKFLWKSSAMKSANGRFQLIIYFNNTLEWFKEIVLDLATRCHTVTRCGFFNVINCQLLDDSFLLFFFVDFIQFRIQSVTFAWNQIHQRIFWTVKSSKIQSSIFQVTKELVHWHEKIEIQKKFNNYRWNHLFLWSMENRLHLSFKLVPRNWSKISGE